MNRYPVKDPLPFEAEEEDIFEDDADEVLDIDSEDEEEDVGGAIVEERALTDT
jgi:hypothetical protein